MEKKQFLATAIPKRDNFLQNMSDEEKAVMAQHFDYVNRLFSEGKILLGGASLDGGMGLIIYLAESYEEALDMYEKDPLIQSTISYTNLHPFKIGLIQNIDKDSI